MEDTLGELNNSRILWIKEVLILVLMEDTLGEGRHLHNRRFCQRLNPCFNGRYSRRAKTYISLFIAV